MSESQPKPHKRYAVSLMTNANLVGWLSVIILGLSMFSYAEATVYSDIEIKTPTLNQQLSKQSVVISGTYHSPTNPPTILVTLDGTKIANTLKVTSKTKDSVTGTWTSSISVHNGWHHVSVKLTDKNGIKSTSSQFLVNDGKTVLKQVRYPVLNVEYSQACKALVKSGDKSCPTLLELSKFDSSDQKVSGKFTVSGNQTIREKAQLKNAYMFYTNPTTCVECNIDATTAAQMQIIFIEPTGFSYTKQNFERYTTNSTNYINGIAYNTTLTINEQNAGLAIYHDKYVDDSCMTANMVYSPQALKDTISYMQSGCTTKNFDNVTMTKIPEHKVDLANSAQYKYQEWLKQSKALNVGNCITVKCDVVKNPQANW